MRRQFLIGWVLGATMPVWVSACTENADTQHDTESSSENGTDAEPEGTEPDAGVGTDDIVFDIHVQRASEVDPDAPGTVGIVTWSVRGLDDIEEAYIEFGQDTTYGTKAPVDLNEKDYRTLLLGMKPARTYHFRVAAQSGEQTVYSDDYTVKTGPATDLVHLRSFRVLNEQEREPGFIISSSWTGDEMSVVYILDPDGEIVWWYETDLEGICSARMSEDGKNMWMVVPDNGGGFLARVGMDGLNYGKYAVGSSHDLTPIQGETMAYIDYSEGDCNSIYEITPDGKTREIFEPTGLVTGPCHGNALRYSQKEELLTYSILNIDVLAVGLDGTLYWKLSDFVGPNTSWGARQHGHHLINDGFLLFANNYTATSSAIEYDFEGNIKMRYDPGLFTSHLGDVQRLPGGNTLVSYSDAVSAIHEIDSDGNLVLEIDARASAGKPSAALGYPVWRESMYGPPSDILQ